MWHHWKDLTKVFQNFQQAAQQPSYVLIQELINNNKLVSVFYPALVEDILLPPALTFMQLAKQCSHMKKELWPSLFAFYNDSGLYDLILKNDPKFTLHFSKEELEAYKNGSSTCKYFIQGNYSIASQPFRENNLKQTEDPENILDKAIIFLRLEKYRTDRELLPKYKHWYGPLFGFSKNLFKVF